MFFHNQFNRHNSNTMIHIGLSLLTVALESGASHIGQFPSLLNQIKDETCRNLLAVSIVKSNVYYSPFLFFCKLLWILLIEVLYVVNYFWNASDIFMAAQMLV